MIREIRTSVMLSRLTVSTPNRPQARWHSHSSNYLYGASRLFQCEGMFRFDSAERADREAAAGVCLQVFDLGSGSEARCFERLHRAVAMFAAHELIEFGEGFPEGAGEPTPTHLHLALRHHRRFFPGSHNRTLMPSDEMSAYFSCRRSQKDSVCFFRAGGGTPWVR